MADASDDLGIPMKPARPMGPGVGPGAGPGTNPGPNGPAKPPTMPPRSPDLARAGETMAIRPAEPIRRPGDPAARRPNDGEVRKLTVGREITLSGEITSCDKLIIEGSVEANLNNCRDVEIAEIGAVQRYRLDRGSRNPGPFRRQSGGSKAAPDQGERAGVGHDPLRPDRDRVRRPDLRRRPGAAFSRSRRDPRGRDERTRRELTQISPPAASHREPVSNNRLSGRRALEPKPAKPEPNRLK